MRRTILAVIACLVIAACRGERRHVPRADTGLTARATLTASLGDSVAIPDDIEGKIWLRCVIVRSGGTTDTLHDVLTQTAPIVVGDSVVYGAISDGNRSAAAFAYHAGSRTVDRIPWPASSVIGFPSFAPDGRHVALIAEDSSGARVLVASWPQPDVMMRGAPITPQPTDFPSTGITWQGNDTVQVHMGGVLVGGHARSLRYRVSIPTRVITVDTLANANP